MHDDASRPSHTVDVDTGLKYDRSGSVPIILVPQPSDDPNDPLVGSSLVLRDRFTYKRAELAAVETRCHPFCSLNHLGHRLDAQPAAGGQYPHVGPVL